MKFTIRDGQIAFQSLLMLSLISFFSVMIPFQRVIIVVVSCLVTQYLFDLFKTRKFNYKSSFITSMSLLLLLKTPHLGFDLIASVLAISSKFLIHMDRKHIFNPANFAIVILIFLGWGWITPMQWGQDVWVLFLVTFFGTWLCYKAQRLDVPLVFLFITWGLLFHRHVLFLGDPLPVFFHRLSVVSLYVFAFLMISDPKTTPSRLGARMMWVSMIAVMSFVIENHYFIRHGTLYVLFAFAFFNGLLNKTLPGKDFIWKESVASY